MGRLSAQDTCCCAPRPRVQADWTSPARPRLAAPFPAVPPEAPSRALFVCVPSTQRRAGVVAAWETGAPWDSLKEDGRTHPGALPLACHAGVGSRGHRGREACS